MKIGLTVLLGAAVLVSNGSAAGAQPEASAQRAARLEWWREGRFGLFIHYGPVTLTGEEISWSRANSNPHFPNKGATPVSVYDNLYREFNPTNFHASDWSGLARAAGMKYVVLTAKHCDGFLLWDSKVDGYNIMATPFKRDICAELARAVRKDGLRLGWYFSPMDWRDADFRTDRNSLFLQRMQGELAELLRRTPRLDLLWFDYDGGVAAYDQERTYAIVKQIHPRAVINNRLDLSVGNKNTEILSPYADYYTPEQQIGSYDDTRPWETCMTLGTQWSWKPDDKIKTVAETVAILARTAGGDGNLLLNVGPMPDGRVEPRQAEVLKGVGAWLKVNGRSIYGTRGGPFKPCDYGTSTRKGRTIYLHVLKWPTGSLKLPALPARVRACELLAGGKAAAKQTDSGLEITVDPRLRSANDTVVVLKLDRDAMGIAPLEVRAGSADAQPIGR